MKMILKSRKKESGEIILFVIFVMLFLVVFVALFLTVMLMRQTKVATNVAYSVQAYYIADSGSESVLYNLSQRSASDPPLAYGDSVSTDGLAASQGGTCTAVVSDGGTGTLKVDILGTYRNTSRAIQLFW